MSGTIASLITALIDDPRHGWSVGTFGAIGEFTRDEGEAVERIDAGGVQTVVSPRGGMRVAPREDLLPVAYDTLNSDGETWGQSMVFCLPVEPGQLTGGGVVRDLGRDTMALRAQDRDAVLFDMGVGLGHVRMGARSADAELIAALRALEGRPLAGPEAGEAMRLVLKTSPNRVLMSPVARLEVYSPIPAPGGQSPHGPHTHLLPKMLAAKRTHPANTPVPEGYQPVLALHPRTPWRDALGHRTPFDAGLDADFVSLLARYGLSDDQAIRTAVEEAVRAGLEPEAYPWPATRRGRTAARITLRRLAQHGAGPGLNAWRSHYDRLPEEEPDEEAALHA